MRIVSLVPSATEIVCALGLADSLVGISHDCDFPPAVRGKPVLSEAVISTIEASPTIESRIRNMVHSGRSVYHLDARALARLRPDLILTQELCSVCAPSSTLVRQAATFLDRDVQTVSLEPRGLTDVLDNIRLVGELTGTGRQARALVARLRDRIDAVRAQVAGARPRVVCLEWLDPLYAGGHWVPEMVDIAGGVDMLGPRGGPSRIVEWDEVVAARPQVIVLMPCGFDIARTRVEVFRLSARPGWGDLQAVRQGRIYLTDASSFFNRPGPRLIDGLEILAAITQPGRSARLPAGAVERL